METKKFNGFTGSTLKIIAIVTMFIDHLGAAVLEYVLKYSQTIRDDAVLYQQLYSLDRVIRLIGRVSFPIFCFLLVEGFLHTSNKKRYAIRLFLFALISEIPFDLAFFNTVFDFKHQNVFFTLLIGLLVMMGADYFHKNLLMQNLIYILGLSVGHLLRTDYGYKGVLLIIVLYLLSSERREQALKGALTISWELTAPLAFLAIYAYNGKRGLSLRYFFYLFYPVHLLLLCGIARLIMPQLPNIFRLVI